jgi:hypothetical protein
MLQAVAAFNAGDVDGYLASYADDARVYGLPAAYPPTKNGLRAFPVDVRAGVPDLHVTVEDSVAEGDRVAGRLTYVRAGSETTRSRCSRSSGGRPA